jgi:hypothetical protein
MTTSLKFGPCGPPQNLIAKLDALVSTDNDREALQITDSTMNTEGANSPSPDWLYYQCLCGSTFCYNKTPNFCPECGVNFSDAHPDVEMERRTR